MLEGAIVETTIGGIVVFSLHGEHDVSTVADLRQRVHAAETGDAAALMFDLSATSFMDSSVLSVMVFAEKHLRSHVAIVAPPGSRPHKVLQVMALGSRLQVFDTRDAALVALNDRPASADVEATAPQSDL